MIRFDCSRHVNCNRNAMHRNAKEIVQTRRQVRETPEPKASSQERPSDRTHVQSATPSSPPTSHNQYLPLLPPPPCSSSSHLISLSRSLSRSLSLLSGTYTSSASLSRSLLLSPTKSAVTPLELLAGGGASSAFGVLALNSSTLSSSLYSSLSALSAADLREREGRREDLRSDRSAS